MFGYYLQVEFKRLLKILPAFLTGAAALAGMLAAAAFFVNGTWNQNHTVRRFQVGIVAPGEDQLSAKAVSMLSSLDSIESICDFVYMDEENGRSQLRSDKISALMVIPDRVVEGIMDGTNVPVRIIMKDGADIPSQIFRELTRAGVTVLGRAQAGIYATDRYCMEMNLPDTIPHVEAELNQQFIHYALNREMLFKTKKVSAVGDVNVLQYYLLSGTVVLMMFGCFLLLPLLLPEKKNLAAKLDLIGVNKLVRILCRIICVGLMLALIILPSLWLLKQGNELKIIPGDACVLCLIVLDLAAFAVMLGTLCKNRVPCMVWLLFTFCLMLFTSGGIVPEVFLPGGIRAAREYVPVTWMLENMKLVWKEECSLAYPVPMILMMPLCVAVSTIRSE